MFDTLTSLPTNTALEAAQGLFLEHGHGLTEAAGFISGPSAEARVVALGRCLAEASRMTDRLRRDLAALHRLLSLEEVPGHVDEILVLSDADLASPRIADICLLTDRLGDILETIAGPTMLLPPASRPSLIQCPGPRAA
jgi:hypothetical protein